MSSSDLLLYTNQQRTSNGLQTLQVNSLLNAAAQTKAEDMVARNYWSHNTPDGKEPWTFIVAAGYQYTSAGENLAYGFMNGLETINGWMNSPTHKENVLNKVYTEVGFGFASSSNFVNNGQQTVIVAFYGTPTGTVAHAPSTQTPPQNSPQAETQKTETPLSFNSDKTEVSKPITSLKRSEAGSVLSTKAAKKTQINQTVSQDIQLNYAYAHTIQFILAGLLVPCVILFISVRMKRLKRLKKYSIKFN